MNRNLTVQSCERIVFMDGLRIALVVMVVFFSTMPDLQVDKRRKKCRIFFKRILWPVLNFKNRIIRAATHEGAADYVSMSRPFIIEPDIVKKFKNKEQRESRCIDCGYCHIGTAGNALKCYYGKVK